MKSVAQTSQFKRDLKRTRKRGKDLEKLKTVVSSLVNSEPLDRRYRDHALTGQWAGSRDCNIDPDWLLIYRLDTEVLYLERTGSHSDLFR